jgi:hypothetical protein
MKAIFFLIISITLFTNYKPTKPNRDVPLEIVSSIKQGDSKHLAQYFNSFVELSIFDKEDVYSKAQAELIVKDFFSKNPPSNFILLYQGGETSAQYAIGNLSTSRDIFKVYFLLNSNKGNSYIHQLRIERE